MMLGEESIAGDPLMHSSIRDVARLHPILTVITRAPACPFHWYLAITAALHLSCVALVSVQSFTPVSVADHARSAHDVRPTPRHRSRSFPCYACHTPSE